MRVKRMNYQILISLVKKKKSNFETEIKEN
jgi:hypothetical protein